ncbi:MAG: YihY/virulence factor BrkB family protein [Planctomycetaceae bacterium]|nr:YihY/virulence factor BrkB family protein [Planctomycetaceae bacterium]
MQKIVCSVKHALKGFSRDDIFTKASSLAFYAMLSLAPMLILLVTVSGLLGPDTKQRMIERMQSSMGPQAGEALTQLIEHARAKPMAMKFSAIAGLVATLLAAIAVFTNLQQFLNHIFQVHPKRGFIFNWLYKRVLSLVMLLIMGVLLLCAIVAASILSGVQWTVPWIPQISGLLINLVLFTLIFVMMFTVLPDVQITWQSTFIGGLITAILFLVGSWGIGMYLGRKGVSSVYGAAGSLVVLLLWLFYSGVIVLFGAELTESYLRCYEKKLKVHPVNE